MPLQHFFDNSVYVGQGVVVREVWKSPIAHMIDFSLSLLLHFRIDGHSEEEWPQN